MRTSILATCIAGALAACVTTPQSDSQVEAARAAVRQLGDEPRAAQDADRDLQAARQALQNADDALQQHRPPAVVDHYAYLAQRHAEAGEARVQAALAQSQLARAQDERNRILLAQRAAEARAAHAQAQSAQAEAESAQSQLAQAQQQLQDLQAKQTDRGTVVTLGDVLFDTAGATLKPGADLSLGRLATYLQAHPDTRVRIEGHTDSRGSDDYNQGLSQRRAQAVAAALEARGIPADSITAIGRGKSFPVASNDTPAGRQQNRRVEIVFSDNAGRFAQSDEPTRR